MARNNYWFDFDDLSDVEGSDALSDSCMQDANGFEIKRVGEQHHANAKGCINQLVDKLIHCSAIATSENCSAEDILVECMPSKPHVLDADAAEEMTNCELSVPCIGNTSEGNDKIVKAGETELLDGIEVEQFPSLANALISRNGLFDHEHVEGDREIRIAGTNVEELAQSHLQEYIARRCFFDWESLPDVVLSQRERGVICEDLCDTGSRVMANILSSELPESWLCCNSNGHPLGKCQNCDDCEACVLADHSYICWELVQLEDHPFACERCNCPVSNHTSCTSWHSKVQTSLKRFRDTGGNTKMLRPPRSSIPVAALHWDADDVALYVLTEGLFDPREHGRSPRPDAGSWRCEELKLLEAEGKPLVSCITPTSSTRQSFHPLLYECFRTQIYEPKELIVIETGDTPSQFLKDCSRSDPRVVYRYWPVDDARMQDLSETVMEPERGQASSVGGALSLGKGANGKGALKGAAHWQDQQKWQKFQEREKHLQHALRLKAKLRGKVRGGKRQKGWTLGMKRNMACHLARGDVIAHMDDDDLYAPIYLTQMVAKLQDAARYRPLNGRLAAAAVTLEAWHVLDLSDQTFGFFAPRGEDLLDQAMRESFAYGFGFSYMYSKAAWDLLAFADVEWSEDGTFTTSLLERHRPVKLVNPRFLGNGIDAICAHSHHRGTTSGGEFTEITFTDPSSRLNVTKAVRMGKKVSTPKELASLLPLVRSIVTTNKISRYDVHPVRQEVTLNPAKGEIGLDQKQDFMRRFGAGLGQWPRMPQSQPHPSWAPHAPNSGKNFQQWGKSKGKGKSSGWPWSQGMRPPGQVLKPVH